MTQQNPDAEILQNQIDDCTQDCLNCHTVCYDAAMRIIQGGERRRAEHISSMLNCAELCLTTAHFLLSNSLFYTAICQVCADVCTRCKELCASMGEGESANACQACAESCRQLAKMQQ